MKDWRPRCFGTYDFLDPSCRDCEYQECATPDCYGKWEDCDDCTFCGYGDACKEESAEEEGE